MAALEPLGSDYAAGATRAFTERWIDLYPTEGKQSGAYSNGGAYDVHPYMLLNYNGKYSDMSTLAHELYSEITRRYYGHDKGVVVVDDYIAHEWAYIPHFYRTYYVFQ